MSNYFDEKTSFMEPIVTQYGSRMVMTNVVKSKTIKYFNFDTRFSENTDTDFIFHLPERITNVTKIKVSQIEIPITFYNISSTLQNNFFLLKNVTTDITIPIIIDNGNYSQESFVLKITSLFLQHNIPITFNINSNNMCSFTNLSTTSSFLFNFSVNYDGTLCKDYEVNLIQTLFGFKNATYRLFTQSTIITERCFNINTIRYLFLSLDDFTNSSHNGFNAMLKKSTVNKQILARIPINNNRYPFGSILHGKLIDCNRIYHGPIDLQKFKIQLINEYGLPIYLNGGSFSFIFEIEIEE